MKLTKSTTLIGFVFVLTLSACGGGSSSGGSGITSGINHTSSSTSVNITPTTPSSELVFGDSLNPEFGVIRSYESTWKNGATYSVTNYDGQISTQFLQWKTVESPSADHRTVIEVNYNTQDDTWAQLHISPKTPQNLSAYATGTLSFDVNILNWGDAYDPKTGTATLFVGVECKWPCSSHNIQFDVRDYNVWQHVSINVADLEKTGADLTQLDSTLIIGTAHHAPKNFRYQLDNIQWTKGTTPSIKPKITFAEHFNTAVDIDSWVFVPVLGQQPTNSVQKLNFGFGIYILQSYTNREQDWILQKSLAKTINLNNKKISLQIRIAGGSSGHLRLMATDTNGRVASTGDISLPGYKQEPLNINPWFTISVDTNTTGFKGDDSFNAGAVSKLSIGYTGNQDVGGSMFIDEIIITE